MIIDLFIVYKSGFEFCSTKVRKKSNPGKLNFDLLVHIFRYIRDNKTLVLKYYADMNDAPVSDLLRQAIIKAKKQLMAFSDSSWQFFQTLAEVQDHILYFTKVVQLVMAHMFQD